MHKNDNNRFTGNAESVMVENNLTYAFLFVLILSVKYTVNNFEVSHLIVVPDNSKKFI